MLPSWSSPAPSPDPRDLKGPRKEGSLPLQTEGSHKSVRDQVTQADQSLGVLLGAGMTSTQCGNWGS